MMAVKAVRLGDPLAKDAVKALAEGLGRAFAFRIEPQPHDHLPAGGDAEFVIRRRLGAECRADRPHRLFRSPRNR